jgi:pimeloyl-ACP methyl ester carboxylesterase
MQSADGAPASTPTAASVEEDESKVQVDEQPDDDASDTSSTCEEQMNLVSERATISPDVLSPHYSSQVWIISARPSRKMNRFARQTLMFQPDIRLFCHHGERCGIVNRGHWSRYCHTFPSYDNQVTESNPYGIPGIERTWRLDSDREIRFVGTGHNEPLPSDSDVILYIHGHRNRYFRVTAALNHIKNICNSNPKTANRIVIGFLWPCHANKVSYGLARSRTPQAAGILRQAIAALQSRGNRISDIVGHSMGARVALTTLLRRPEPIIEPVERLIMLAAAVPCDSLDHEFLVNNLEVKQITNINSENDDTLATAFRWGEIFSFSSFFYALTGNGGIAMGLVGIRGSALLQNEILLKSVNASTNVLGHSIHAYLASKEFSNCLI